MIGLYPQGKAEPGRTPCALVHDGELMEFSLPRGNWSFIQYRDQWIGACSDWQPVRIFVDPFHGILIQVLHLG